MSTCEGAFHSVMLNPCDIMQKKKWAQIMCDKLTCEKNHVKKNKNMHMNLRSEKVKHVER